MTAAIRAATRALHEVASRIAPSKLFATPVAVLAIPGIGVELRLGRRLSGAGGR